MKIKITLFIILFFQFAIYAQSNTVSTGETATGTTGSITYTIGQIGYKTYSGTNGTVSQGMQQVFDIVTLGTNDITQIELKAMVYPNPTVQNVTLTITDFDKTNLNYQLFDIQGRMIRNGNITQNETQIEMSTLAVAQYFLKISDNNTLIKTFKIIKNN